MSQAVYVRIVILRDAQVHCAITFAAERVECILTAPPAADWHQLLRRVSLSWVNELALKHSAAVGPKPIVSICGDLSLNWIVALMLSEWGRAVRLSLCIPPVPSARPRSANSASNGLSRRASSPLKTVSRGGGPTKLASLSDSLGAAIAARRRVPAEELRQASAPETLSMPGAETPTPVLVIATVPDNDVSLDILTANRSLPRAASAPVDSSSE